MSPSSLQTAPSRWRPAQCCYGRWAPDAAAAAWLFDAQSLTRRLKRAWQEGFKVRPALEGWGDPSPGERRMLNLDARQAAWIRCVELCCNGAPRILARTAVPPRTLRGRHARLRFLGTRPLGETLFSDPRLQRLCLEIARLPPHHPLFPALDQPAWGRRSLFRVASGPLIVYEVFTDALLHPAATLERARAA